MFCVFTCIFYNGMTILLNQTDNTHRVRLYSWLLIFKHTALLLTLHLLHFKSIPWDQHWSPHLIISIGIDNAELDLKKYLKERMLHETSIWIIKNYVFIHSFLMKILSVFEEMFSHIVYFCLFFAINCILHMSCSFVFKLFCPRILHQTEELNLLHPSQLTSQGKLRIL